MAMPIAPPTLHELRKWMPAQMPASLTWAAASEIQIARRERTRLATCSPQARPRAMAWLLPWSPGRLAREAANSASKVVACAE